MSSNTVYHASPDAPVAEIEILPNPNDGHFDLKLTTNATKQYVRIIGPYGMVYGGWVGEFKHFDLLPINPNGTYSVIVDWYFDDDCSPVVRTKTSFILVR
jgi:hypothetical protein